MIAIELQGSQGYTENQLSKIIFDCALRAHHTLGSGLLINVIATLIKNGINVKACVL